MHLTINIVVNLPGEGGWIKMEFWKSGLLNDFALAVAVNRFLTEPIKIQQLDFRGRRRWSHHEAPVSLCNGWNFGCGSGRSQMTEGAGCRFDSLSCDYSLQGKKSITGRRQSGVWSELQTPADNSLLFLVVVAGHQDIFCLTECRNPSLSFYALTLRPIACLLPASSMH